MPLLTKKLIPFLFLFCFFNSYSQNSLSYTTVALSGVSLGVDANGNLIDFSSASNIASNNSSFNTSNRSIGFDFYFMGKKYTNFIGGQDGLLGLVMNTTPSGALVANAPNDLTRNTVAYPPAASNSAPVLAAFWDDLGVPHTGTTIKTVITGTAPNRCRIISWTARINTGSSTSDGEFQIRLYETTGMFEYIYGSMAIGAGSGLVTASIGFSAGANDGQFLALQSLTAPNFIAQASQESVTQSLINSSTPGIIATLHSTTEGNRKGFRFTPPVLSGTGITGMHISNIGATVMSLNWNDNYTNEAGFLIYRSTDNINYTQVGTAGPNSTTFIGTGLSLGATYYWKIAAFGEAAIDTLSNSVNGTTSCSMNGTYQIGPGGQFATLTEATTSLKLYGMTGSILFEVLPGYTSASETFPITFPKRSSLPCMTSSMNVILRPAAGAVDIKFTGFTSSGMFELFCDYLTIDGRPGGSGNSNAFTIMNNTGSAAILFGNASNNIIRNTNCVYNTTSGVPSYHEIIYFSGASGSTGSDSNQLISCNIYSTDPAAPRMDLIESYSYGGVANDGNQVINCNLYNFAEKAINLREGNSGWIMQGNSFYTTGPVDFNQNVQFIYVNSTYGDSTHIISGNYFGGSEPSCSGNPMKVNHKTNFSFINGVGRFQIKQNQFKRIEFRNTGYFGDSYISLIKIGYSAVASRADISGNEFGGNAADSIHVTHTIQTYATSLDFNCVLRDGGGDLSHNKASSIRCYSTTTPINLSILEAYWETATKVDSNRLGDPSVFNSIGNFTSGTTYGMDVSSSSIRGNIICRITGVGNVTGMMGGGNVKGNKIFHLHSGATLSGMEAAGNVDSNQIYAFHAGGTVYGIKAYSGNFKNNLIYGLNTSGIAPNKIHGISADPVTTQAYYMNNMIRLGLDSLGNNIVNPVFIYGLSGADLAFFNTVVIAGSNVLGGSGGSICLTYPNIASVPTIWNNILVNQRSNAVGSIKHYCILMVYNPNYGSYCNYNLYFAPGPDNYLGLTNATAYKDISSWRSALNFDLNGKQINPLLIDPLSVNAEAGLHLQKGSPAESMGGFHALNTEIFDYDNQIRQGLTPIDVGADAGDFVKPFAGRDTIICTNTPIQLGEVSSPNLTYTWSSIPAGFSSSIGNPVVSPAVSTTYIVTADNGFVQHSDTVIITVANTLLPTAIISSSATTTCSGQTIIFNSAITNAGNSPIYQWKVNGVNVGTNSGVFSSNTLSDGSLVQLEITSSVSCASPTTVVSNTVAITINPIITPAVTIQASKLTVCPGESVLFTATPANGGPSPQYQWLKNGQIVASGTPQYISPVSANGDQFQVNMTSNANCTSLSTVISNMISIQVANTQASITINGNNTVNAGGSTLITSSINNGGTAPVYQWQDSLGSTGWTIVAGSTNSTINYTPAVTGVKLRCQLTSNGTCVTPSIVTSNVIQFIVNPITGINPVTFEAITLSPNPTMSRLSIQPLQLQDRWHSLEIQSIFGQEKLIIQNITGLTNVQVNVSQLASGTYILLLKNEKGQRKEFKFIKF